MRDHALAWIWRESKAFNAYRGEAWMPDPCRGCALRTTDFGGCRCQAYALTGDATRTDPACRHAPDHHLVRDTRRTRPARRALRVRLPKGRNMKRLTPLLLAAALVGSAPSAVPALAAARPSHRSAVVRRRAVRRPAARYEAVR